MSVAAHYTTSTVYPVKYIREGRAGGGKGKECEEKRREEGGSVGIGEDGGQKAFVVCNDQIVVWEGVYMG
jgi:hypothetical protein